MAAYERVTLNRGGRNSRFDCISVHVPKRAWQFASENASIQEWPLYKRL